MQYNPITMTDLTEDEQEIIMLIRELTPEEAEEYKEAWLDIKIISENTRKTRENARRIK